LINL